MPLLGNITLPASANLLALPNPNTPLFIAFICSKDPITNEPWCPDVRIVLPSLNNAFSAAGAPDMAFVETGQRPAWKAPNVYREKWNVNNVPTLVRFERVEGAVRETGRLEEEQIKDEKTLYAFIRR